MTIAWGSKHVHTSAVPASGVTVASVPIFISGIVYASIVPIAPRTSVVTLVLAVTVLVASTETVPGDRPTKDVDASLDNWLGRFVVAPKAPLPPPLPPSPCTVEGGHVGEY